MAGITDIVILGGVAVGVYFFYTECIVKAGCGLPGGGGGVTDTGGDTTGGDTTTGDDNTGGSTSTSTCGDLCRTKDCSGYKDQCTTGCIYCCNSGPNSPSCSGGSSSGGVNCNDGNSCTDRCRKGWCTSFKACCKGGTCDSCLSTTGRCTSVRECATCQGNNHRVCNNGKCGCAPNSSSGGGSSGGGIRCCQGSKCITASSAADCCRWRGDNGGCGSNQLGVPSGGGCSCIADPYAGYTHSYRADAYMPMNTAKGFASDNAISRQRAFSQTHLFNRSYYRNIIPAASGLYRVPQQRGVRKGWT